MAQIWRNIPGCFLIAIYSEVNGKQICYLKLHIFVTVSLLNISGRAQQCVLKYMFEQRFIGYLYEYFIRQFLVADSLYTCM